MIIDLNLETTSTLIFKYNTYEIQDLIMIKRIKKKG